MMNDMVIEINSLVKSFGDADVVKNSNMTVPNGCVYGFLGPNGAGKTTIFKMITGLTTPTSGIIKVLGTDVTHNKTNILQKIGSLIESPVFYDHLSATENLEIHLDYMGIKGFSVESALTMVGLNDSGTKPVGKFSQGMRQRLGIARAFIHKPQIIILDEPINGLDPMGIRNIRNLFLKLIKEYNMTILLSSHILSEIEHVADIIGVLVNGKVVKEIPLKQIKEQNVRLEDYFFDIMSGGNI